MADTDQILKLVQSSLILSDTEKEDWAHLLPLMNDKQLSELANILNPPAQNAPNPALTPMRPSLTHISNLPTQIDIKKETPVPPKPPVPFPASPKISSPPLAPSVVSSPLKFGAPPPRVTSHPVASPYVKPSEVQKPQARSGVPVRAADIKDLEEVKNLQVNLFKKFDSNSIVEGLKRLAKADGSFQVILAFEQSPLFQSYIDTGQKLLQGQEGSLTKSEFEIVTDIIRKVQGDN